MLVCVGALIASEIGYWRVQEDQYRVVQQMEATAGLSTLLALMSDAETSQRGHLLTGRANYLETFNQAVPKIDPLIGELRRTYAGAADPSMLTEFDQLVETLRQKLSELELTIAMAKRGETSAARELVLTDIGKGKMDLFRAGIVALQARERASAARSVSRRAWSWRANTD